jgi:hypothetical protein
VISSAARAQGDRRGTLSPSCPKDDTPDLYRSRLGAPPTTLLIEETYLLYCTQMLAVIGNLAPLYTRGATGDSILRAASEVEMLAIAISTKHLSKAESVRMLGRDHPRLDHRPSG